MERQQLFRLCHGCGHINEGEQEILRCNKCAKAFLPMNYFERLRQKAQAAGVEAPVVSESHRYNPLNGLIVFW